MLALHETGSETFVARKTREGLRASVVSTSESLCPVTGQGIKDVDRPCLLQPLAQRH
ncbi:hypothetical protein EMIT0215P_190004 [Pseudomonas serboccidentalis]